ncbi:MAG TPA: hypothetical protein VGP07_06210, partial [Polyangia bacterium]
AGAARAQTGGTTGTTVSLSSSDFFIGVQKVQGVNLSDVDKAKFLNHASCQCARPVWLKAIFNASSAAKAATIPGTDTVTMKVGQSCDQRAYTNLCPTLNSMTLSEFRLKGMVTATSVDVLAHSYGINATDITGTGGVTVIGSGGAGGDSGTGGTSGSGGSTGGPTLTTADDPCAVGDTFSQPIWLFVETTPGLLDVAQAQLNVVIDGTPPPTPIPVTVSGANEALLVTWTNVNPSSEVPDLQGYQVFCTRADRFQVFKSGTFDTSIDSCIQNEVTDLSTTALTDINTNFLCSGLLSTSTTSTRLQILENDINYAIAVAAVDFHGNAALGFPVPLYTHPIRTYDFYHEYRVGDPQGQATGGCAVATSTPGDDGGMWFGLASIVGAIAVNRRRRA